MRAGFLRQALVVTAAVAAVLSTVGLAASASEQDRPRAAVAPQAGFMLKSNHTNLCLTALANMDGAGVAMWSCNGSPAQRWSRHGENLSSDLPGKCLDVVAANGENGAALNMFPCHNVPARNWYFEAGNMIANRINGKCLTIDNANPYPGAAVHMWDCVGVSHQQWLIT